MRVTAACAGLLLTASPAPLLAQQAATPAPSPRASPAGDEDPYADDAGTPADIVVTGSRREPGAVIGDIPPELQLSPADIRSYGVSSISELVDELAPETQSGRGSGRPAILLNGKRISSFHEIRDLPTEAILRVDILPEQVALKYGYSADQKVINIVLRQHFHSTTIEARDRIATEGGQNTPRAKAGLVTISPTGRFSLDLDYQQSDSLLESERDLAAAPPDGVFDRAGNITAASGSGEIDPALSAAAGEPVTIAGVPAGAAASAPTLGAFAATANRANVTDLGPYRTLLPKTRDFTANAVYARGIGDVSATLNGSLEVSDSTSRLGLPGVSVLLPAGNPFSSFSTDVRLSRYVDTALPLRQSGRTITSHLGTTFNGAIRKWNWSVTATYDRADSDTFTDTGLAATGLQTALDAGDPEVNPFATLAPPLIAPLPFNRAQSISSGGKVDALLTGTLLRLPAGSASTSIHLGAETSDFTSRSTRAGLTQTGAVSRDIVNGRVNLDLPIASRSKDVLAPLGDLSANLNVAEDHLSDFGTLSTLGYGINWGPIDAVRALVSFTRQDDAPSPEQLGGPVLTTPNSRVFDYVRGQTVDITRISGGNPNLDAATRHIFEAELNLRPLPKADLRLIATYTATRTTDEIAGLPAPTAAVEAAFPDRFVRDAAGQLVSIDARPVNFAEEDSKQLRWGFHFSQPLKSRLQREMEAYRNGKGPNPFAGRGGRRGDGQSGGSQSAGAATPAPHGGFRGRGRGFGGRGGGGGRLTLAVYHTWRLEDAVHIRDGLPVLDLLNGAAGTKPRHEVQVQAGYFNNGLGARLSANWQSGTRVDGGTPAAPDTLTFSPLATFDLRLFADLGSMPDLARKHPWTRGMRVSLSVNNLFDSRQHVTDSAGQTPIRYQPDYLDPLGRTVSISIRKLFYQRSNR